MSAGFCYIHVRDLVVGDREGARGPRVQVLHARLRVDVQQAGAAQGAVDLDRALGGRDAVLAQDHDLVAAAAGVVDEVAEHVVELARGVQRLRALGAEALVVVVEVRQVDQQQVELLVVEHDLGRVGDPLRRLDVRRRAPVLEEREVAQRTGQVVVQLRRIGVGVRRLAAVGVVDRARRDGQVRRGAHRVPPAEVRGAEAGLGVARGLPHLLALHELVVLAPEEDLAEVAEVPAVADDAVVGRRQAGEERRLHRAGDRRDDRVQRRVEAVGAQLRGARHVLQRARGETHRVRRPPMSLQDLRSQRDQLVARPFQFRGQPRDQPFVVRRSVAHDAPRVGLDLVVPRQG